LGDITGAVAWLVVWKAILSKIPLIRELAGLDGKKKEPAAPPGKPKPVSSSGKERSRSRIDRPPGKTEN